ncbi:hypothetical protein ACNKHO_22325 [Shigella flexneri]
MAFTIGKYGVGTLVQLGQLIICFYITCILFVVVVLGSIARATVLASSNSFATSRRG